VKLLRQSTVSLTMSELTQAIYGTTDEYDKRALRTMVHHLRKRGIEITSLWHHEGPAHASHRNHFGACYLLVGPESVFEDDEDDGLVLRTEHGGGTDESSQPSACHDG